MSSGVLEDGKYCAVCYGVLTNENIFYDHEGFCWDLHKGECARKAGYEDAEV